MFFCSRLPTPVFSSIWLDPIHAYSVICHFYKMFQREQRVRLTGILYSIIDDTKAKLIVCDVSNGSWNAVYFLLMSAAVIFLHWAIIWLIMFLSINSCIPWRHCAAQTRKCYPLRWEPLFWGPCPYCDGCRVCYRIQNVCLRVASVVLLFLTG